MYSGDITVADMSISHLSLSSYLTSHWLSNLISTPMPQWVLLETLHLLLYLTRELLQSRLVDFRKEQHKVAPNSLLDISLIEPLKNQGQASFKLQTSGQWKEFTQFRNKDKPCLKSIKAKKKED